MYRLFSFAALCCLLVSCASGDNPSIKNDLPTVRDLGAYNEKLFELVEANTELSARVIGIVEYPGFRADIIAVTCSPENGVQGTALVTGGVHGNEPAGAAFTLGLIQALSAKTLAHENTAIDIIPMVNPWGWAHDSRFNYDGKDINRDFASFRTQEAGIIRDYVKGRSYDLALDHHEDPGASGVYIYQYGKSDDSAARAALSIVKEKGYPLEQDVSMIVLKTDDGLIDAPMWGLHYMRLTKQLSMSNYLRLEHSKLVYTVETPTVLKIDERLVIHDLLFRQLAESAGIFDTGKSGTGQTARLPGL